MFRRLLQTQCLLAQVEAGKAAVEYWKHPKLVESIEEHTEHAGRYDLLLLYIDSLKTGAMADGTPYQPKLLVNATPEELQT